MNKDVFLAILAMDAYNRGYRPSFGGLPNLGDLGQATIIDVALPTDSTEAGFYGIAYDISNVNVVGGFAGNDTVISYRGTDEFVGDRSDIWHGWTLGAGFSAASQGGLAIAFYEAVALATGHPGDIYSPLNNGSILTTGHSLGGGLAGYIAAISRGEGVLFDHMPFGAAAFSQYFSEVEITLEELGLFEHGVETSYELFEYINDNGLESLSNPSIANAMQANNYTEFPESYEEFYNLLEIIANVPSPELDAIRGLYVVGEVNEGLRDGSYAAVLAGALSAVPYLGPVIAAAGIVIAAGQIQSEAQIPNPYLVTYGFGTGFDDPAGLDRHSIALLVTLKFGEERALGAPGLDDWKTSAEHFLLAMYNEEIAKSLGFSQDTRPDALTLASGKTGFGDVATQLRAVIAYSALEEGDLPFGNVAIRALFNDADDLGRLIEGEDSWDYLPFDLITHLSNFIVHYAGAAALGGAHEDLNDLAENTKTTGVLTANANGSAFSVILDSDRWSFPDRDDDFGRAVILPVVEDALNRLTFYRPSDGNAGNLGRWQQNSFVYSETSGLAVALREQLTANGRMDAREIGAITYLSSDALFYTASELSILGTSVIFGSDDSTARDGVTIVGSNNEEIIFGTSGADTLSGGAGQDILIGGAGRDVLSLDGSPFIEGFVPTPAFLTIGELGTDDQGAPTGYDYVFEPFTGDGYIDNDYLFQFEAIITGGANDTLNLHSIVNSGNDWELIDLGNDPDAVLAESENDLINASQSDEGLIIDLSANAGSVFNSVQGITSGQGFNIAGVESIVGSRYADILHAVDKGIGNKGSSILGGDGNDIIYGSVSNNSLNGGAGDDVIHLFQGDIAQGGDGADSFYVTTTVEDGDPLLNHVYILDFDASEDSLYVNGTLFSGYVKTTVLQANGTVDADGDSVDYAFTQVTTQQSSYGYQGIQANAFVAEQNDIPYYDDGDYRDVIVGRIGGVDENGKSFGDIAFVDLSIDWALDYTHGGNLPENRITSLTVNEYLRLFIGPLSDDDNLFTHYVQTENGQSHRPFGGIFLEDLNLSINLPLNVMSDSNTLGAGDIDTVTLTGLDSDNFTYSSQALFQDSEGRISQGTPFGRGTNGLHAVSPQSVSSANYLPAGMGFQVAVDSEINDLAYVAFSDIFSDFGLDYYLIESWGTEASLFELGILARGVRYDSVVTVPDRGGTGTGGTGSHFLWGGAGNDSLTSNASISDWYRGDVDLLIGGHGDDFYEIDANTQRIVLSETFGSETLAGGVDHIFADFDSTDVTVVTSQNSDSVRLLVDRSEGGTSGLAGISEIEIADQLSTDASDWIETIEFADGVIWTRAQLLGLAQPISPLQALELQDVNFVEGDSIYFNLYEIYGEFVTDDLERSLSIQLTLADGSALPAWLLSDGVEFFGDPPPNYSGSLEIALRVNAGGDFIVIPFTLNIGAANDAPESYGAFDNLEITSGEAINQAVPSLSFFDLDGDTLTLTATLADGSALPSWLVFDGTAFTGQSPVGLDGELRIRVTASDGELITFDEFYLIIANDAPIVTGTEGVDALTGTVLAESFFGLGGNDAISGGGSGDILRGENGNDTLQGDAGDDLLIGGAGNDVLDGGAGNDTISYADAASYVRVSLATVGVSQNARGGGHDTLIDAQNIIGSAFDDVLFGDNGDNHLEGGDGADQLTGGDGNDHIFGGLGDDRMIGSGGNDVMAGGAGDELYDVRELGDTIIEYADEGTSDAVQAYVDFTLSENVERLTLWGGARVGIGNSSANAIWGTDAGDTLSGLDGDDVLRGKGGGDTLTGGLGDDLIDGGLGVDTMTGGTGRDTFQFRDGDASGVRVHADVITDFDQSLNERIQLNLVDANSTLEGNQDFEWISTSAFSGAAGEMRYQQISGDTYIEGDINGDGVSDFTIKLLGLYTLGEIDIIGADDLI